MTIESSLSEFDAAWFRDGHDVVVVVHGDIDMATAPHLQACLDDALAASNGDLAIDLADVGFMGSSGLAVLIETHNVLTPDGRSMIVRNSLPRVQAVFEMSGLSAFFSPASNGDGDRPAEQFFTHDVERKPDGP